MTPSIAICIPSGETWKADMGFSLVALARETQLDLVVLNFQSSQITFSRNQLVKLAMEAGVDYLFWWDSDMILPSSALYELLAHKKDIVGATYCKKKPPYELLGKFTKTDGRLKASTYMPGGCMLVAAHVYSKIGWPYYFEEIVQPGLTWQEGGIRPEDFSFCKKALANGFEIWCDIDLSQRIDHIGSQNIRMQLKEGHPDRVIAT